MSNIQVIPQFNLSTELAALFNQSLGEDDLSQGVSSGFPMISIRGAKWRLVQGGEETAITMPGTKDLAPFIKVVLLKANPRMSKTFYAGQYVEGSDSPPDCSSGDGIAPYADSPNIQNDRCETCKNNVWGSKISPSGAKIKACADVRRMAVIPADDMEFDAALLRVPGASLGDLAAYGKALKMRHIPYCAVVTKLSFDPDSAYPKINFQFERVLTAEEMQHIADRLQDPSIEDILGLSDRAVAPALPAPPQDDKFGIPADAGKQVAANKVATDEEAKAEAAKVAAEMEAAEKAADAKALAAEAAANEAARPKTRGKKAGGFGGGAAEPEKVEAKAEPKPEPVAQPESSGDMMAAIDAALDGLNF